MRVTTVLILLSALNKCLRCSVDGLLVNMPRDDRHDIWLERTRTTLQACSRLLDLSDNVTELSRFPFSALGPATVGRIQSYLNSSYLCFPFQSADSVSHPLFTVLVSEEPAGPSPLLHHVRQESQPRQCHFQSHAEV